MSQFLGPRRSKDAAADSTRIKEWVSRLFGLDEDTTVMVTELRCSEPGCPPIETVIAILSNGGNRQHKLHKRIKEVDEEDVRGLLDRPASLSQPSKSAEKGEN
jgi:hypothetical protein